VVGGTGDGSRRKHDRQPFLCVCPRLERVRPLPLLSQKGNKKAQLHLTHIGLDHGVGHFWPLSITRQRHLLAYHFIAMRHEGLSQVF